MKTHFFGKEIELKIEAIIIAGTVFILLGCLIGSVLFKDNSDIIIESGEESTPAGVSTLSAIQAATETEQGDGITSDEVKTKETIKIYVVGCVKKPGIVTIEKGQMLDDAVREAGGLTEDADSESINMVYVLNENVMLYIKSKKETDQMEAEQKEPEKDTKQTKQVLSVKDPAPNKDLGMGAVIIKDSGYSTEIIGNAGASENDGMPEGNNSFVNINSADAKELDTLPGIGEATARDIIAFRESNGGFKKIEDIMKVPRIKQNRFNSIKDYITVD